MVTSAWSVIIIIKKRKKKWKSVWFVGYLKFKGPEMMMNAALPLVRIEIIGSSYTNYIFEEVSAKHFYFYGIFTNVSLIPTEIRSTWKHKAVIFYREINSKLNIKQKKWGNSIWQALFSTEFFHCWVKSIKENFKIMSFLGTLI